ncbi:MAG: hypothetical protein ABI175_13855 [Polyangiales bacterium]
MSAYRNGEPKRSPESGKGRAAPRTELIVGVVFLALGGLLLAMFMMRKDAPSQPTTVVREPSPSATPPTATAVVPQRPESLSERQHVATTAAISLANAAMLGNHNVLARLAMAMADAITDASTTCGDYDRAYAALSTAVLAVGDAGELGDVGAQLGDIEAARCTPGSDAGG